MRRSHISSVVEISMSHASSGNRLLRKGDDATKAETNLAPDEKMGDRIVIVADTIFRGVV